MIIYKMALLLKNHEQITYLWVYRLSTKWYHTSLFLSLPTSFLLNHRSFQPLKILDLRELT